MFSMKGEIILKLPMDVLLISVPLSLYFFIMYMVNFYINKKTI